MATGVSKRMSPVKYGGAVGRYYQYLPEGLRENYEKAKRDPDWLALGDEIALMEARIAEQLSRVAVGQNEARWQKLREAYKSLLVAEEMASPRLKKQAMETLREVIEEGAGDADAWLEVERSIEAKRKLSETERKRLEAMGHTITLDKALVLLTSVAEELKGAVLALCPDEVATQKILERVGMRMGGLLDLRAGDVELLKQEKAWPVKGR